MLRVGLSTFGRFHALDLAVQLSQHGALARLYTAYPWWRLDPTLKPVTRSFPWLLALVRFGGPWLAQPLREDLNLLAIRTFDRWAARRIEPCDVFVHLSSVGLESATRARALGARVVCDRGSSHILFQDAILREEYARQGIAYREIDRRLIEREMREYEQADAITVPSRFAHRSFIDMGVSPGKVHVTPYGVDLAAFRPLPKQDDRFRVIFVGTCSLRKGIGYLFDAARPLIEAGHVEVWLVGDKREDAYALLGRNRGLFVDHGPQPKAKLPWYYSQASVLVLPSVEEGLALVQAQAMACGVPVIATTNTGAEDLFTDEVEGFIVPIRDADAIRQRLERLLATPASREAMGAAALARIQARSGWREYGGRVLDLYAGLAEDRLAKHHEPSP